MKVEITYRGRRYVAPAIIMEHFGVVMSTFYDWRAKNLLPPPLKLGRRTFYDLQEVEDKLLRQET